jgi:hypothetical protein
VKNRILNILLVSACLVASAPLWGQNAAATRGIHGYLDPRSGIFHPFARMTEADVEPQATKTFTGKFVFNYTITVDATIAATAKIACSASAVVEDNVTGGSPNIIEEEASALATRSGSTATCTVNIPYSWNLATSTTDMVTLGYTIAAPAEATATTALPSRFSSQSLPAIKIPVTGATTTETIAATF